MQVLKERWYFICMKGILGSTFFVANGEMITCVRCIHNLRTFFIIVWFWLGWRALKRKRGAYIPKKINKCRKSKHEKKDGTKEARRGRKGKKGKWCVEKLRLLALPLSFLTFSCFNQWLGLHMECFHFLWQHQHREKRKKKKRWKFESQLALLLVSWGVAFFTAKYFCVTDRKGLEGHECFRWWCGVPGKVWCSFHSTQYFRIMICMNFRVIRVQVREAHDVKHPDGTYWLTRWAGKSVEIGDGLLCARLRSSSGWSTNKWCNKSIPLPDWFIFNGMGHKVDEWLPPL